MPRGCPCSPSGTRREGDLLPAASALCSLLPARGLLLSGIRRRRTEAPAAVSGRRDRRPAEKRVGRDRNLRGPAATRPPDKTAARDGTAASRTAGPQGARAVLHWTGGLQSESPTARFHSKRRTDRPTRSPSTARYCEKAAADSGPLGYGMRERKAGKIGTWGMGKCSHYRHCAQ